MRIRERYRVVRICGGRSSACVGAASCTPVSNYNYSLPLPLHFSSLPRSPTSPRLFSKIPTMIQRRLAPLTTVSRISSRITAPASSFASLRCRRQYSIHADAASGSKLLDIDPTKLSIEQTSAPKPLQPQEELVFGRAFTGTGSFSTFPCYFSRH